MGVSVGVVYPGFLFWKVGNYVSVAPRICSYKAPGRELCRSDSLEATACLP